MNSLALQAKINTISNFIMEIGPNTIIQCLNCDNLLKAGSLNSGNYLGAVIYSDVMTEAPMMNDFPIITKCHVCKTIFWIDKAKEIAIQYWCDADEKKWEHVKYARALTFYEIITAVNNQIYDNIEEEIYLRLHHFLYNNTLFL